MKSLVQFNSPQLNKIHQGKVRDSFRINDKTRMIITTDRLSCFDNILETSMPNKGAILNELAHFWFLKTEHIIQNHLLKMIDPRIILVKEAKPIKVEMIVRRFLTGSLWRGYQKGERIFCGITLPDGMKEYEAFPQPIITPTTKSDTDRNISPTNIVEKGLITKEIYIEMQNISLELFSYGQEFCKEKGIILVDTKYEFGLINEKLCLIDEIHTPDSSRFWLQEDYENDHRTVSSYDKEYLRQWLINNNCPTQIPKEVMHAAMLRYNTIYERILSKKLNTDNLNLASAVQSLIQHKVIQLGYISIILGSKNDLEHALKIQSILKKYPIMINIRVVSAHKNGEDIVSIAQKYNDSIEPGVVIAIAGRSNGLGGALSANLAIPVINCPPFKNHTDLQINIFSSLIMPSDTPATVCIDPENAAKAALRALNIPVLRTILCNEITKVKENLRQDDFNMKKTTAECHI